VEDFWVFRMTQTKIANVGAFDAERVFNPPRKLRRKMSIYPDNHAARIGWLTR
jgi:hypothetical protein